jgi:hypothetical protein
MVPLNQGVWDQRRRRPDSFQFGPLNTPPLDHADRDRHSRPVPHCGEPPTRGHSGSGSISPLMILRTRDSCSNSAGVLANVTLIKLALDR